MNWFRFKSNLAGGDSTTGEGKVGLSSSASITLFGRVELFWRNDSWRRPGEWVFEFSRCPTGCLLFDVGWWGVTVLRGSCVVQTNRDEDEDEDVS